ncbi:MAG TPA: beta-ketoacyl synthase N-terminal-like domain-containing protein [Bacteroidia bacterium]|nr:beta-ketoacyl synthase N-terminal-like domain-containing protein [Bacteroidia bacterium]
MIFTSYNNIISPLGFSTQENYQAVTNSIIGVKKIKLPFSQDEFCVAKISDDKIQEHLSQIKNADTHTKLEQLSILSIQDVINQSGINPRDNRTLLIYSTTKGNIDILSFDYAQDDRYKGIDSKRAYLSVFAKHLQSYFQLAHTPVVLSNACISGILAIIIAKRFIEQGAYDNVLVCGGDILSEFTISGFKSFNALSSEPSKPFDANRVGINLGEAVSTILITNQKGLATPYNTQLVSGASANDANHISGPSRTGDGLFQCLTETLKNNSTTDIGFISAHGTATPFNDEMESIAFDRAGLNTIPVNSLKGYYGHTLGAAGVLETILSLESMQHQRLIKSEGFEAKGVTGNVTMIESHQDKNFTSFIKTASGFGGCNAAALFKKYKHE